MKSLFRIVMVLLVAFSTLPSVFAEPDEIKHELQTVNLQVDNTDINAVLLTDAIAIHQISAIPIHTAAVWLSNQDSLHLISFRSPESIPITNRSADRTLKHDYNSKRRIQTSIKKPNNVNLKVPWQQYINEHLHHQSLI